MTCFFLFATRCAKTSTNVSRCPTSARSVVTTCPDRFGAYARTDTLWRRTADTVKVRGQYRNIGRFVFFTLLISCRATRKLRTNAVFVRRPLAFQRTMRLVSFFFFVPTFLTVHIRPTNQTNRSPEYRCRRCHCCCPTDVDECVTPANNCKFACKNLIGSFACVCADGYAQVGADECRDVDECAANANACQNGFCENLPGTYRCDCHDGFKPSRDGKQCLGACNARSGRRRTDGLTGFRPGS